MGNYYYDSESFSSYFNGMFDYIDPNILAIGLLVSLVVSFIVYVAFLTKNNEGRYTGFKGWLYEVLNFNKLIVEPLLKIIYMFIALYMSIFSIAMMKESIWGGLLALFLINLFIRIGYEFILMFIMLCKNTREININLKNQNSDMRNAREVNYNIPPFGQSPVNQPHMGMQQSAPVQNVVQPAPIQSTPVHNAVQPVPTPPIQNTSQLTTVETVKSCVKCGSALGHDDAFCPNCGTKVVE